MLLNCPGESRPLALSVRKRTISAVFISPFCNSLATTHSILVVLGGHVHRSSVMWISTLIPLWCKRTASCFDRDLKCTNIGKYSGRFWVLAQICDIVRQKHIQLTDSSILFFKGIQLYGSIGLVSFCHYFVLCDFCRCGSRTKGRKSAGWSSLLLWVWGHILELHASFVVSQWAPAWMMAPALLADLTLISIRNTQQISLTVEHLEVLIPTLACILMDHPIRSSITLILRLVTSLVDLTRLLLHPLSPHKGYLEWPPVQELKGQVEMRLLAVDLVSLNWWCIQVL